MPALLLPVCCRQPNCLSGIGLSIEDVCVVAEEEGMVCLGRQPTSTWITAVAGAPRSV